MSRIETSWWQPQDGHGTWQDTPRHSTGLQETFTVFLAALLGGLLFIGLVTVGRSELCRVYAHRPQPPSYCAPHQATQK